MGITKTFFTAPIIVPLTFRQRVADKSGGFENKDFPVVFTFNRESDGQQNGLKVAASLFSDSDNFERFCRQLAVEPQGIDDFPKEGGTLYERAKAYFSDGDFTELIRFVVMEVERAQKPLEFFRLV